MKGGEDARDVQEYIGFGEMGTCPIPKSGNLSGRKRQGTDQDRPIEKNIF
jgi:hypothetical protein